MISKRGLWFSLLLVVLLALLSIVPVAAQSNSVFLPFLSGSAGETGFEVESASFPKGTVVIANRGSGTISVIDVATDQVIDTITLPGDSSPEPMYVVYVHEAHRVFVGDRANSQVAVYDAKTFELEATVATGAGVFHMWADEKAEQLWVNNDIDKTVTVINPRTMAVIATVDVTDIPGKPHDVVLDAKGEDAYVAFIVGDQVADDFVVKFDTQTFEIIAQTAVGKDPHVSLAKHNNLLYVPAQNADAVYLLDRYTMEIVDEIAVPGAHGTGMRDDGRVLYTTNLPGGGTGGLVTIDTTSNTVLGTVDTPVAVPHNIALTKQGDKIYVTHSGHNAETVTVYTVSKHDPVPEFAAQVTVGKNPFGLAYVP